VDGQNVLPLFVAGLIVKPMNWSPLFRNSVHPFHFCRVKGVCLTLIVSQLECYTLGISGLAEAQMVSSLHSQGAEVYLDVLVERIGDTIPIIFRKVTVNVGSQLLHPNFAASLQAIRVLPRYELLQHRQKSEGCHQAPQPQQVPDGYRHYRN
jgi:hypothetical protein